MSNAVKAIYLRIKYILAGHNVPKADRSRPKPGGSSQFQATLALTELDGRGAHARQGEYSSEQRLMDE